MIIESLVIAYPTLLGFFLCFGAVIPFLTGGNTLEHFISFIEGLVVAAALISGWRIFFWVITDGPKKEITINKLWWFFAAIGASLTVIALVTIGLSKLEVQSTLPIATDFFALGGYFLIPFFHILLEVWWQKGANKSFKPTPESGAV